MIKLIQKLRESAYKIKGILLLCAALVFPILDIAYFQHRSFLSGLSKTVMCRPILVVFAQDFKLPWKFGYLTVSICFLGFAAMVLLPYTDALSLDLLRRYLRTLRNFILAYLGLPVLMMMGGFAWKLLKKYLPGWLDTIATAFGVKLSFFVGTADKEITTFDGSIASFLGLALGIYILARILRRH